MAHGKTFVDEPNVNPELAKKAMNTGLALGVLGLIACAIGGYTAENERQVYYSGIIALMTFTTISLGGLFFVILHHLVRASWSTSFRRIAENVASAIPVMGVLAALVFGFGLGDLFHWSHPEAVAADPLLQHKEGYLNTPFFAIRALVFFLGWTAIAFFYRKLSVQQDESGDVSLTFRMRWWAPVCILFFALSVTFAGFDWMMGLDAHWFSTMFGVIIFSGCIVGGYATLGLIGLWLTKNGNLKNTLTEWNFHDVAKLMWGFIIFWTYTSFSQYFLIWYGNIPEETAWFYARMHHGWERIAMLLIFGHFMLPFWVILSRHMKRNRLVFGVVACWMILMHYFDLYFMAMPNLHHHLHFHWLDLATFVCAGGFFLAAVMYRFTKDAAVAHRDPMLEASLNYYNY
ncbi:MAG: hypothetical protein VX589_05950 [Myxococcota bacterium]|nr:hypothetical protein [Myxococcota bacterium]